MIRVRLRRCVAASAGLILLLVLAGALLPARQAPIPTFRQLTIAEPLPPSSWVSYNFLNPLPFAADRVWITVHDGIHDSRAFLFDLQERRVLGELEHATPVFLANDARHLVCLQRAPAHKPGVWTWIRHAARQLLRGRPPTSFQLNDVETFWTLDLATGMASRIGQAEQPPGTGSVVQPSPSGRLGFTKPMAAPGDTGLLLLDAERRRSRWLAVAGTAQGWWDDTSLLMRDAAGNFLRLEVETGQTNLLLSQADVRAFAATNQLPGDPADLAAFGSWNGREYDCYLTHPQIRWKAETAPLARLDRSGPRLQLMDPAFKFEWSDHFSPSGRGYLYSGRNAGERSDGVFLRELPSGREITLVEPAGQKAFSLPNWYREGAVYVHNNALWWVDHRGSNRIRLFPPPPAP